MVAVLMVGRVMWVGWPFHPIGLVLMNSGPLQAFWFSIFIGWGVKRLLLRYGGAGAFRRAQAVFHRPDCRRNSFRGGVADRGFCVAWGGAVHVISGLRRFWRWHAVNGHKRDEGHESILRFTA